MILLLLEKVTMVQFKNIQEFESTSIFKSFVQDSYHIPTN